VHVPPTKVFQRLAVNKTILKPCLAAATGHANMHMWDFPDIIKSALWHIRYQRKQSGSSIWTIICIGSKVNQFVHVPTSVTMQHNPCTRFWVILLTDRETNECGETHLPPPLLEVIRMLFSELVLSMMQLQTDTQTKSTNYNYNVLM